MKAIIVEDEISGREYLKSVLNRNFKQLEIVAEADNVPDAVALIRQHRPHIVYLDVEIKLGTGFDVLDGVKNIDFAVIFTTAFDHFAIEAFRRHAVDYLLKPLQRAQIAEATERAMQRANVAGNHGHIAQLLQQLQQSTSQKIKLGIYTLEGIEFVNISEVMYAEAKGNYTELVMASGVRIVSSRQIKDIEESLPPDNFFRVHNSYIVNMQHVSRYHKGRGGYVVLSNGASLPVSANRKDSFLEWLQ